MPETQRQETNGGASATMPPPRQSETPILDSIVDDQVRRQQEALRFHLDEFKFMQSKARMYSVSGLFGKTKADEDPKGEEAIARAMVRMELGKSMGFSDAESLKGVYVISDQTCVAAELQAARMKAAGYDWDIKWYWSGEPNLSECIGITLFMYRGRDTKGNRAPLLDRDGKQVEVSYLKSDAQAMLTTITDWVNNKPVRRRASILEKDNWKMTPRNMYFARAVTNARRWYASEVLSINIKSVEEVMDEVDRDDVAPPVAGSQDGANASIAERIKKLADSVPAPKQHEPDETEDGGDPEAPTEKKAEPSPVSPVQDPDDAPTKKTARGKAGLFA